jgi:transcriptional regulator with XRE-family HTH domain
VAANPPPLSLSAKVDRLFTTAHPGGRAEYTYREVADGIMRLGFARISGTYLWQLRTGSRTNPTIKHLEGLATFFGVPVNYFFNDAVGARVDAELDVVAALHDSAVRHLAVRAAGLSHESLTAVGTLIEHLRRLERVTASSQRPSSRRARRSPR